MIELSKNILQKSLYLMEENSYHNLCLMEKSVVNPFAYVYISDVDISKIFNASYNKNAKYIYFTINDERYIKFQVNINLNSKADDIDRRHSRWDTTKYEIDKAKAGEKSYLEYITLEERGKMNRHTVEVYCNGYKIPDKNILITLFSGSIDLYIPARYINAHEEPSIALVVNRYSVKDPYYNSYSNSIDSDLVKIPFISGKAINLGGVRVYKNGLLATGWTYDEENETMDISSLDIHLGDEVEFIYHAYNQSSYHGTLVNKVITFDKELLKDKPIFADIVETYINGVRQFPKDITNVSPRNIALNNFQKDDIVDYYLVYDETFPEERNKYIDDLTRFFSYKHDDASLIINGEYEGYLPEYIKHIKFPPDIIKVMNEDIHKTSSTLREFLETKTKEYIAQNPEFFKYLLRNLSKNDYERYYDYEYIQNHIRTSTQQDIADLDYQTFDEPMVVFSFTSDSAIKKELFILSIDGKVEDTENSSLYFYNRNKVYLYIPLRFFNPDMNIARILHFPVFNTAYKYIDVTSDVIQINKKSSVLGVIQNINDLFIMKKSDNGYLANINISREEDDNYITITINDYDANEEYILYNASITDHIQYVVQAEDIEDKKPLKIPYDKLFKGNYYPMMSFYSPVVIRNNKLLTKGTEYLVLSQFNNPTRNIAEITFGINCSVGDVIDIYYTECYYESMGGIDYINNDYGIIYFENLLVPFDSGYLDLYVNGRIVDPANIEVISTNMIRVSNVDNLINVGIRSKLNVPINVLKDYTNTFINNPSLWDEYIRRYWYDNNRIDEFYLEMHPDATQVHSDPSEEADRFDIMVNYIARFFIMGLIPRLIDCNQYYDFSNCHYIRELLLDPHDYIELNCNKEQLAEIVDIDMAKYMKSYDEIVEAVSKVCEDGNILNADVDIPDDSPLWLEIYPDELEQALF